ncbi:hypothetical protein RMCBS344292_17206 [Rhizopus microsporus]|nr:hypothetical protein RMCBS344292_17206 [Rhizopus microsporus]
MLFAGSFDTTMDGQTSYAPASQIIPLPKTGATASNSASTTDTASSIVCATSTNSNAWILKDGQTGTWQTTFGYYSVNPSLVRIANSRLTNHQTKEFGVRPIDNATYFQMAYLDPASNTTKTCTTNCVLSNDASVEYQDFRILNTTMTSGIAIDIKSWYGSSGGLASVSVFQSENFIYAIDTNAENTPCGNNTLKRIETKGSWTRINDGGLAYYASNATNDSSIIFYPGLAESGNYDVYIYLPQCSGTSCNDRTNLDVHIYTSPGQNATVKYVDASSNAQDGLFLSSAYFNLSLDFQPTIEITAAHNATKTGSIIAHAFQFVKNPSRGALSNIIQYNTTAELQWGPLSTELASNSIVNDIKEYQDSLYIVGDFKGTDSSNGVYNNIVQYNSGKLKALKSGGTNGPIESIAIAPQTGEIFVAGNFSALASSNATQISSVGRYNVNQATWNPLEGWLPLGSGLAGQVTDIEYIDGKLVVTGNMTLNNSPITIAEYDFEKQVWGPFATANLPGPSVAMTYDNVTKHTFISGKDSTNGSTYLRVWNGQQFNPIDQGLGSGSIISRMYSLPVKNTTQNTLLATGLINLGSLGNVSAAFFDGQQWTPYLVTSSASADGFLRSLFYFDIPSIPSTIRRFLPAPLVILVSIAISLGIVFLIVLATMCIIFFKRKAESKIDPQNAPEAYYSKPPRSADSVLAALKDENNNNPNYSAEKLDTLEPEAQIYSMSRSISTDYLHEQPPTPAMMKPTALSPAPPKLPYNMSTNSFYQGLTPSPRPDSFVRPMSDIRRDSQPSSMTVREMSEVDDDRRGSYNPFRRPSSELL